MEILSYERTAHPVDIHLRNNILLKQLDKDIKLKFHSVIQDS